MNCGDRKPNLKSKSEKLYTHRGDLDISPFLFFSFNSWLFLLFIYHNRQFGVVGTNGQPTHSFQH
jgi:hypothetical protein